MYKMIEVAWENEVGELCYGDALVEYIEYLDEGEIVQDIIGVYAPEYAPAHWVPSCKEQAQSDFHHNIQRGVR
jgi:hypothetical protein